MRGGNTSKRTPGGFFTINKRKDAGETNEKELTLPRLKKKAAQRVLTRRDKAKKIENRRPGNSLNLKTSPETEGRTIYREGGKERET